MINFEVHAAPYRMANAMIIGVIVARCLSFSTRSVPPCALACASILRPRLCLPTARVLHHLEPAEGGGWIPGTILAPIPQIASFSEGLDVSRILAYFEVQVFGDAC